jgi:hypothetical protein
MRFRVTRTSMRYGDDVKPPCDDAEPGPVERWDIRTFKSAEEFDSKFAGTRFGKWHDRGTDHQVIRGPRGEARGIKRRVDDEPGWFVELADLAALLAFHATHGELVIETDECYGSVPTIEIYDGWRE